MAETAELPVTLSQLMQDLKALGIAEGQIVMLHSSVKAVGALMGGPNIILEALFNCLGVNGTLMMYAGWQDIPDFVLDLPTEIRQIYYEQHPAFDPHTARAVREHSILAEFLRTWPGAQRSLNPEASMVAVGALAKQITQDHPLDYGYGPNSPLAKLVEFQCKVLLLGAPLDTITLLHYAENQAQLAHKNIIHYQCPILLNGQKLWVDIEDYDTGEAHADYSFEQIALSAITAGHGQRGTVGQAESYLFDAANLAGFAIDWLEEHFGT